MYTMHNFPGFQVLAGGLAKVTLEIYRECSHMQKFLRVLGIHLEVQ